MGKHAKSNAQLLSPDFRHVLVSVIENDSDIDNRTCAMNCLANIASILPSFVLADNDVVACALRVIEEQGTGARRAATHSCDHLHCFHAHTFLSISLRHGYVVQE
jgi:hypothetical protein